MIIFIFFHLLKKTLPHKGAIKNLNIKKLSYKNIVPDSFFSLGWRWKPLPGPGSRCILVHAVSREASTWRKPHSCLCPSSYFTFSTFPSCPRVHPLLGQLVPCKLMDPSFFCSSSGGGKSVPTIQGCWRKPINYNYTLGFWFQVKNCRYTFFMDVQNFVTKRVVCACL